MQFEISDVAGNNLTPNSVLLNPMEWDDWFKFETSYLVFYISSEGVKHRIGTTKIGRFGLRPASYAAYEEGVSRKPSPPVKFESLPVDFFSLAQDPSFYERLSTLGSKVRDGVLLGLRDLAAKPELIDLAVIEEVTRVSLLREVPLLTVKEQFVRLARGGLKLTPYELKYKLKYMAGTPSIKFEVVPDSSPPTNIHVVVGRNGVGKSTFLNKLALGLVRMAEEGKDQPVSNLVSVSFSAFDTFAPISVPQDRTKSLTYHYVGLRLKDSKDQHDRVKGPQALASEMTKSARQCLRGETRLRWVRALRLLESDPIFASSGIADLVDGDDYAIKENLESTLEDLGGIFRELSSGHKIVLLTLTRLVETVTEKTLVLIDEPEAHLHPPLLSSFVRALSDLLINRNGLAIVATHSPVLLQEVPKSCVWKLDRTGGGPSLSRPRIETFGENVGTLTNEVFGLEVNSTGYHHLLLRIAEQYPSPSYNAALEALDNQLGAEGRSVLRALVEALRSRHVEH